MTEEGEEVIGIHESGMELVEGDNTNNSRYYCGNCKRKIHCYVKVEKGEATIHKTCKSDDCECKCRTHYACKKCGYLHPYGQKCDFNGDETVMDRNPKTDKLIEDVNAKYDQLREEKKVVKKPE